jgi:hypothetical protein
MPSLPQTLSIPTLALVLPLPTTVLRLVIVTIWIPLLLGLSHQLPGAFISGGGILALYLRLRHPEQFVEVETVLARRQ